MAKSSKRLSKEWVPGRELREKYGMSEELLKQLRDDGVLQPKTHWIHIGRKNAFRPTYRYHLKRCETAIFGLTEVEQRATPPLAGHGKDPSRIQRGLPL